MPVFLYGELATRPEHVERAWIRRGGPKELARRIETGELVPDYGPREAAPDGGRRAGRGAAAARGVQRGPRDRRPRRGEADRRGPARVRRRPAGRARARALPAERNRAQVSTNVHDHRAVPLRDIVEYVREHAEVAEVELIGLAPRAAFEGFPDDVPLRGFDPERHILEEVLRAVA